MKRFSLGILITVGALVSLKVASEPAGQINLKTLGPCSPATVYATNVTNNCIVVVFYDYLEFVKRNATSSDNSGDETGTLARHKLASPEESYLNYLQAGRVFLKELLRVSGTLDEQLIRDAAGGTNDGPQRALTSLVQSGANQTDVTEFTVSLGDLL